jgi:uncharacterized membrane protein
MAESTHLRSTERMIFFTDAVVAIAMTLLILPLLESVSDAAQQGLDTAGYFREHDGQIVAFALSFVIIAVFWRSHDRLFEDVRLHDSALQWLNTGWMFTIVWLPVATALVGAMETDALQLTIYIGTMLATSLLELAMMMRLRRRPELVAPDHVFGTEELRGLLVVSGLFALALVLAVIVPGLQYRALLVLLFNPVLDRLQRHRRRP